MSRRILLCIGLLSVLFFSSAAWGARREVVSRNGDSSRIFKSNIDLSRLSTHSQTPVPPTILEIVVEDVVAYVGDAPFEELATSLDPVPSGPVPPVQVMAVGDIRQINGQAVRGTYTFRAMPVLTTPNPGPETGLSIADSTRIAQVDHAFEIFQADGTPVGVIYAYGLGLGPKTPGAPLAADGGALAIIGGTGPYLAVRGQANTGQPVGDLPLIRFASARENPAVRRVNGGGTTRFIVHLIPEFAPEVVFLDETTPALFHASDQALVTQTDPAIPGEVLTMLVRNLGPTNPGVDPGQPFPRDPLNIVNSPVDVRVNGEAAVVSFAGGEPTAVNVFEVEFQVPESIPSGRATMQTFVGFVAGSQVQFWVE